MKVTRRDLLLTAATAPLFVRGRFGAGPPVGLQPRSILIDGKPVFLICGSIDYFRCPHELWCDVLLRAKRGGLNCIAFCIAWNFHEAQENVFNFEGDRDLGAFLDLCAELGLYAFPRFGPFICDEWEAGGHPAWLMAKPNVVLRTEHPPTLVYILRWMEKLIPILATRQVTRGGPVIFVQQENEYFFVGRPRVREYQDWLIRSM